MYVLPKGVEHCPIATPDTHFMMIEPANTVHMGHLEDAAVAVVDQHWI